MNSKTDNFTRDLIKWNTIPAKRFKTKHNRKTSKALRVQFIMWLYTTLKEKALSHEEIIEKLRSLKISCVLIYHLETLNIVKNNNNFTYSWNPEIVNPDFVKLTEYMQERERVYNKEAHDKRKGKKPISNTNNINQYDIIIEKLNAICAAIGIQ